MLTNFYNKLTKNMNFKNNKQLSAIVTSKLLILQGSVEA